MRIARAIVVSCLLVLPLAAQQRVPLDGLWQLGRDVPAAPERVYDLAIEVPSTFETVLGHTFDGVAWYRRTLPLSAADQGRSIWIEFAAVATHARVFCNGIELGEHLGGWTPFAVEVTSALQWRGQDTIEVRVDELVGHNTQGFLPAVQPHFGGIWQSVTMAVDRGASLDRTQLSAFGFLQDDGAGRCHGRVALRISKQGITRPTPLRLQVRVGDGAATVGWFDQPVEARDGLEFEAMVPSVRPWSCATPNCYGLEFRLLQGDTELDRHEMSIGFRSLRASGTTVLWNGVPLHVRGILHWGFSPPLLAPPSDASYWRRQLEDWKSLGFNTLKCCLFVPPPCVYELCDELGMLCWQEYPTWHPKIDQAHEAELLREYGEFFRADGSHAAVAFRSITCETGHDADLAVMKALYDACHAAVPETLVVDDSSWIGWQRVTDFWDEHPYGNNRWWPGRLLEFEKHIEKSGKKPLLLGECIAADTWVDRAEWAALGDPLPWWRPDCLRAQEQFESWLVREFGAATLTSLPQIARDYGMATRRYQIERLRATLPDAGYVVSVARDIPKARMGLCDDFGRLKWSASDWSWHRERMLHLATDARGFVVKEDAHLCLEVTPIGFAAPPTQTPPLPSVAHPTRHAVTAECLDVRAQWDIWLLPTFDDARPRNVRVVDHLDEQVLDEVERGGRVLLRVGSQKRTLHAQELWYLRGAPFAPAHPVHEALPASMLIELQPFDLDGGRVIPWLPWLDQVDPILAFWETHDLTEVRAHLFAFDTRIGQGRLLASSFDATTAAGRYVERQLLEHLANGPASQRALSETTIAALHRLVSERILALEVWRFRTDQKDEGLSARWFDATVPVDSEPWRDLRAGSHWENQAEDLRTYTGIAWYRIDLDVPTDWPNTSAALVLEGVDDSCECFLDGVSIGRCGDLASGTSVWLECQVLDLGERLASGRHTLALRVVDHAGAGGLWQPAYVTTGPTGFVRQMLR